MRSVTLLITLLTSASAFAHDGPFFSLAHIDAIVFLACFGVIAAFGCVARFTGLRKTIFRERSSRQ